MGKLILVAGGTGNLGERIVRALLKLNVEVRVVVRPDSDRKKIEALKKAGVQIFLVQTWSLEKLKSACKDVNCVVSALAGLEDVIIDAQKILLDAAIAAKVPRFIPSDFSLDFRKFKDGEN